MSYDNNEGKHTNIIKKIFNYYLYSSYTFHLTAILVSALGCYFTKGLNTFDQYSLIMIFLTGLSIVLYITVRNINYKQIRIMLKEKVISIMRFKNKISDGNRTINTIVTTMINIVIINITIYFGLIMDVKFTFLLYLLTIYVFMLFYLIASLHRQMAKFEE